LRPRPEDEGQLDEEAFEDDELDKDGEEGDTTMLVMGSTGPEYSIEGLRREVRRGRREENWTAYESEIPVFLVVVIDVTHSDGCGSEIETRQQGHPRHRHGEV
jgi:hypothetical protein